MLYSEQGHVAYHIITMSMVGGARHYYVQPKAKPCGLWRECVLLLNGTRVIGVDALARKKFVYSKANYHSVISKPNTPIRC